MRRMPTRRAAWKTLKVAVMLLWKVADVRLECRRAGIAARCTTASNPDIRLSTPLERVDDLAVVGQVESGEVLGSRADGVEAQNLVTCFDE